MKNDGDVICLYSFHIIIYQNLAGDDCFFYETLLLDGPVRFDGNLRNYRENICTFCDELLCSFQKNIL